MPRRIPESPTSTCLLDGEACERSQGVWCLGQDGFTKREAAGVSGGPRPEHDINAIPAMCFERHLAPHPPAAGRNRLRTSKELNRQLHRRRAVGSHPEYVSSWGHSRESKRDELSAFFFLPHLFSRAANVSCTPRDVVSSSVSSHEIHPPARINQDYELSEPVNLQVSEDWAPTICCRCRLAVGRGRHDETADHNPQYDTRLHGYLRRTTRDVATASPRRDVLGVAPSR